MIRYHSMNRSCIPHSKVAEFLKRMLHDQTNETDPRNALDTILCFGFFGWIRAIRIVCPTKNSNTHPVCPYRRLLFLTTRGSTGSGSFLFLFPCVISSSFFMSFSLFFIASTSRQNVAPKRLSVWPLSNLTKYSLSLVRLSALGWACSRVVTAVVIRTRRIVRCCQFPSSFSTYFLCSSLPALEFVPVYQYIGFVVLIASRTLSVFPIFSYIGPVWLAIIKILYIQ